MKNYTDPHRRGRRGTGMKLTGRGNGKNSLSPIDPEELLMNLQLTTGKAA
jgi:hypothetical protein